MHLGRLSPSPSMIDMPTMKPARHVLEHVEPRSKLTFKGITNKTRTHTGYFEYRLDEQGRIWCRWDPVLAPEAFSISCSNRVEFPSRCFDATNLGMIRRLSGIVGPYPYVFDKKSQRATATPRKDLEGKGFVLKNGKLKEVPIEEAKSWHLHDGTGGPKLPDGVKIIELAVQNEMICARGSDDIMYMYHPGLYGYQKNVYWTVKNGFKDAGAVHFPHNMRGWTMGVSTQIKPARRRGLEFMNAWTDVDSYYGSGNKKIANAATITLGVISEDGRSIRIWDTGLPHDLHRAILSPDKGRVRIVKIAQAGSVWVVLGYDRFGVLRMYTRLINYENFGACFGMEHSLDDNECESGSCIQDVGEGIRNIPLAGYREVAFPELFGESIITDEFSVHCTGEGDDARELRIEGRNSRGEYGYFFKSINDSEWRFRAVRTGRLHGNAIAVGAAHPEHATPDRVDVDYESKSSFQGFKGAPISSISLLGFHPFQTQAEASILRFTLMSGAQVEIPFLTADAWSPFAREAYEDESVWTGSGVPKILVGTLSIPKALLESENEEVRNFVSKYLLPYNGIANLFEIVAEIDKVEISTTGVVHKYRQGIPKLKLPQCSMVVTRDARGESHAERLAFDKKLALSPQMSKAEIVHAIRENEHLRQTIQNSFGQARKDAARLLTRWQRLGRLLFAIRVFTAIVPMRKLPFVGPVLDLLPRLVAAHKRAFKEITKAKTMPSGIQRALGQIETNLGLLKARVPLALGNNPLLPASGKPKLG